MKQNNVCLRWVDTGSMLADCLTKSTAAAGLLLNVFRNGRYGIVFEVATPAQ